MKFQVPVTFDSANRKRDKSVSFRLTSNYEVSTEDFSDMDRLVGQSGWLLFSPNELADSDVPAEDAPSDAKKPSQRLRGVLWHLWDQHTDRAEPFDLYYQRKMESITDQVKQKLT